MLIFPADETPEEIGAVLQNGWSGHWVLGIGYASAEGHDFLVASNDPWEGKRGIFNYTNSKGIINYGSWQFSFYQNNRWVG